MKNILSTLIGIVSVGLFAFALPASAQNVPIRIATWNIENFDSHPGELQFDAAVAILNRISPDIICLQEIISRTTMIELAQAAGYSYFLYADDGNALDGMRRPCVMSRYPFTQTHVLHAYDLSGDDAARDITRNFAVAHVDVPGPGPDVVAISNHWSSESDDPGEFLRSVETLRAMQVMDRLDSPVIPYFLGADMNADLLDPPRHPWYFYAVPVGMPHLFNLGSDIEFPVGNSVFDPLLDETGSQATTVVDAYRLDGYDWTHYNRARIDYLWHSDAMSAIGSEVYDSENEGMGGGLTKYGDPLPPEASRDASDHLMVFADVLVSNAMHLSPPGPGMAGEQNTITVEYAEPLQNVYYVYSLHTGTTPVPGCPDLMIEMHNPKVAGVAVADDSGTAVLSVFIPLIAQGKTVLLQAVDPEFCSVSNRVEHGF